MAGNTKIVKLVVKSTPNKELLSALTRLQCDVAVGELFTSKVAPLLRAAEKAFGDVLFIKATVAEQELNIEAGMTLADAEGFGAVTALLYTVCEIAPAEPRRSLNDALMRQVIGKAVPPAWSLEQRPALHTILNLLRSQVIADNLGWHDAATGKAFIARLGKVLYEISKFHDKLAHFRLRVPDAFSFAKGANDWKGKGKGKKELMMTQPVLQQQQGELAAILNDVWLSREPWNLWKQSIDALEIALGRAIENMACSARHVVDRCA